MVDYKWIIIPTEKVWSDPKFDASFAADDRFGYDRKETLSDSLTCFLRTT